MLIPIDSTLPLTKEVFSSIYNDPSKLFELMNLDLKAIAEKTLSAMLKQELTHFLGREKYERSEDRNHRNGRYGRKYAVKGLGELAVEIPRDRKGQFESKIIQKYDRYENALKQDICMMFLSGCSTRSIKMPNIIEPDKKWQIAMACDHGSNAGKIGRGIKKNGQQGDDVVGAEPPEAKGTQIILLNFDSRIFGMDALFPAADQAIF